MLVIVFKVNPTMLKAVRKSLFSPLITTNYCYNVSIVITENNSLCVCGMVSFLNSTYP